jgi:ABC-type multidrug transport system ATPase subunit
MLSPGAAFNELDSHKPEAYATGTTLWTLSQITLRGSGRHRLDSVSLDIQTGVTAVVGESGAGKSSLLGILVGLDRPDSGSVTCHIKPAGNRLPVYWLPPGNGLWSPLTVREHLEIVAPAPTTSDRRIDRLLLVFDLTDLAKSRPDDLSQGERARLALARALASDAQVLVLDEPLVHTSYIKNESYWQIVRDICRERQISLIFTSHDLSAVRKEADRVVILNQGRIVFTGAGLDAKLDPPDEIAKEFLKRIRSAGNST